MKIDYLNTLRDIPGLCARFKNEVIRIWFTSNGKTIDYPTERYYCLMPAYRAYFDTLERCIEICDLLGVKSLETNISELRLIAHVLGGPISLSTVARVDFEDSVSRIISIFSAKVKAEIESSVSQLSKNETERLNEALHCYLEGCFFSTVAMAVTAIEYRLLQWMKKVNPSDSALDGLTLGQLVGKCLAEDPYKSLLPKKYHPLLQLSNEYRVFSVHAKSEPINKRIAASVSSLSIEFLFDSSLLLGL
jgi:hypothetical protein